MTDPSRRRARRRQRPATALRPKTLLLAVNAQPPSGYVIPARTPAPGVPLTRWQLADLEGAATAPDDADHDEEELPMQLTFAQPNRHAPSSALDDYLNQDLIPLREATRLAGNGLLGNIEVIRNGNARYVRRHDLERLLGHALDVPSSAGAGTVAAHAIGRAQKQRADAFQNASRASQARRDGREYKRIKTEDTIVSQTKLY